MPEISPPPSPNTFTPASPPRPGREGYRFPTELQIERRLQEVTQRLQQHQRQSNHQAPRHQEPLGSRWSSSSASSSSSDFDMDEGHEQTSAAAAGASATAAETFASRPYTPTNPNDDVPRSAPIPVPPPNSQRKPALVNPNSFRMVCQSPQPTAAENALQRAMLDDQEARRRQGSNRQRRGDVEGRWSRVWARVVAWLRSWFGGSDG